MKENAINNFMCVVYSDVCRYCSFFNISYTVYKIIDRILFYLKSISYVSFLKVKVKILKNENKLYKNWKNKILCVKSFLLCKIYVEYWDNICI